MSNTNKWSFEDQDSWGSFSKCNSKLSPININTESIVTCEVLCKLSIDYITSSCKLTNRNNLITIKYDKGSKIKFKNEIYNLEKITFHTPSLHKINGEGFDLEVCLYHSFGSNKDNNVNNGIIISSLYREGENSGTATMFFNDFINDIPSNSNLNEVNVKVWKNWTANLLIPKKKSFFMYDGSLSFPPCTDKYKILVFEDIGSISKNILDIIRYNIGNNSTKIQPLGNRTIYYNPSSAEPFEKPKRNFDIIKDDKYLRCVKQPKPSKIIKTKTNKKKTKKKIKFKQDDLTSDENNKIRNNLILITILVLFINCFFIIKWSYKNNYMINILNNLGGKLVGGTIARNTLFNINQMYNQNFN